MGETPSRIGSYEIVRRLGAGVMSDVYMASGGGNVYYAVKVIKPHIAQRLDSARRFLRDLTSDNLLQYKVIEEQASGDIFVSDYLEVRPATRQILRTTLSDELLEMYATVAEAAALLHDESILHGNIKPSNILVRRTGPREVMGILGDPGIGYHWEKPAEWTPEMIQSAFACMAPEKIRATIDPDAAEQLTPAADIYSMTAALVESLTGRNIYREADTPEGILKLKEQKRFRLLNVNWPAKHVEIKDLNALIDQNLAVDPQRRVQSMREFAESLRACKVPQEQKVAT